MARKPVRDVVVLIPGLTGSVLERRDGMEVWAPSLEAGLRAFLSAGRSLNNVRLSEDPVDAEVLDDGVRATRLVPDVHLIPGLWKIDGYSRITDFIQAKFTVEPGANYFEFPYDWRRDNRVAARRLDRAARDWLLAWRERSGATDARLVLLAHSMGGLVARHFLEVLGGWEVTRTLVTFGTPYRGSLNALDFLSNGFRKLGGLADLTDLVHSFTSVYQLLPIYGCIDDGNGKLVHLTETGQLPGLNMARVAAADEFHREIERAVHTNRAEAAYRERGYAIQPIVGIDQPTGQSARLGTDRRVQVLRTLSGSDQSGDGTVPRISATPIELSKEHREVFAATRHASLQNADAPLVQIRGVLDRTDLGPHRGVLLGSSVSVDLDDLYELGEPVVVRALVTEPGEDLHVSLVNTATGLDVAHVPLPATDEEWRTAELPPQPAGTYRVTVSGAGEADPVSDLLVVG